MTDVLGGWWGGGGGGGVGGGVMCIQKVSSLTWKYEVQRKFDSCTWKYEVQRKFSLFLHGRISSKKVCFMYMVA